MSQPVEPSAPLSAEVVIEELGNVHGATQVRLSVDLAKARARIAQLLEQIAYLESQLPAGDGTAAG